MPLARAVASLRAPRRKAASWGRQHAADAVDGLVRWCATEAARRALGWRLPRLPKLEGEERPPARQLLDAMDAEEARALFERRWARFERRLIAWRGEHIGEIRRALALPLVARLAYALAVALAGQTPGQRALGLRVVDARGRRPALGRSLAREVASAWLGFVMVVVPPRRFSTCSAAVAAGAFVGLVEALWPLLDEQRRTPYDVLAGTWVVEGPAPGPLAGAAPHGRRPPPGGESRPW